MRQLILISGFALLNLNCHAQGADRDYWIIPKERLECIVANLETYSSQGGDPILIFVDDCPAIDLSQIMSKRVKNSLPVVKSQPSKKDWDEAIVFSKTDLACVSKYLKNSEKGMIQVKKKPCE
jgi:hypothetical protein